MQIHAPEGLKRIRALVSSLDGVVGCGIETQDGGAIRTLRVASEPDTDPGDLARRIRAALGESLEVYLAPDQLSIEADRPSGEEMEPPDEERGGNEHPWSDLHAAPTRDRPDRPDQPDHQRAPAPDRPAEAEGRGHDTAHAQRRAGPTTAAAGSAPFRFGGYALFGEPTGSVELRVRVRTAEGRFEGTSREAALDRVTSETFVSATLRAAELALDARPVDDRSSRILILEQVDVEEVDLEDGPFVAVTIRALNRDGERCATGFEPLEGSSREAAARAVFDAVQRILEGRDSTSRERPPGGAAGGSESDPFFTWS